MGQYIVSARKYRPSNFETLIGQDNIAQTLKNSIIRGQLAHAYLFCGPRGVGKTSTARIFAKIINCASPSELMEPCGNCESCVSFEENRSYCIHELDAASNNGVEDIKILMEKVRIPPQLGKYSVFIIDEVHMLSQSAFNAFLKTLEEPPAHAIFILATTEKHKILPTILSRCQTYDFNRITIDNIVKNLRMIAQKEGIKIDDESLHIIANKGDGAMRDSLTIFDQTIAFCGNEVKYEEVIKNLNVLDYEHSFNLVDAFLNGDYSFCLNKFDQILTKGFNALHFIAALSAHFRDLSVAKCGGIDSLLELPDSLKLKYKEQAEKCSMKFIYDALSITTACESSYRTSVSPRLHVEFALMRLAYLSKPLAAAPSAAPVAVPSATPVAAPVAAPSATPVATTPVVVPSTTPVAAPSANSSSPQKKKIGGFGLSIKSVVENNSEIKNTTKDSADILNDEMPSEELVVSKWPELCASYSDKPRLVTALKSAELKFSQEDGKLVRIFFVINVAQQEWIKNNLLRNLDSKLRELLNTSKIILKVDVHEVVNEAAPAILPREKAVELMNSNSDVNGLVKELELDCN